VAGDPACPAASRECRFPRLLLRSRASRRWHQGCIPIDVVPKRLITVLSRPTVAALSAAVALSLVGVARGEGGFDPTAPSNWRVRDPDLYGVASRGERVFAVGYWGTLLRSVDGGATWSRRPTPTRETLYDISFADDRYGWTVGEHGVVLRSTDGGDTWSRQEIRIEQEGELRPLDLHLFGVAALSPDEAWAVGDLGALFRVRDGEHWERVVLPDAVFADGETAERILNAVDFYDRERGWIVGEFGTVLRTTDGGETWTGERRFDGVPGDLYLFDVAHGDAGMVAAVGLAGEVMVSRDGGATWNPSASGLNSALYGITWGSPEGAAVGDRGEIIVSADSGRSWQPARRPPLFEWLTGVSEAEKAVYAVGERGVILRSRDAGASWEQLRGPAAERGVGAPPPVP
jgi:photosystem II stability/assembly factor-like uncharacterized protein